MIPRNEPLTIGGIRSSAWSTFGPRLVGHGPAEYNFGFGDGLGMTNHLLSVVPAAFGLDWPDTRAAWRRALENGAPMLMSMPGQVR